MVVSIVHVQLLNDDKWIKAVDDAWMDDVAIQLALKAEEMQPIVEKKGRRKRRQSIISAELNMRDALNDKEDEEDEMDQQAMNGVQRKQLELEQQH